MINDIRIFKSIEEEEEQLIRMKAAELSITMSAAITNGIVSHGGLENLTQINPLGFANDCETYIRYGIVPKPICVEITKK